MEHVKRQEWTEGVAIKVAQFVESKTEMTEKDYLKLKLGVEVIVVNITKLLVIFLIASILNLTFPLLIIILVSAFVKLTSLGAHASTNLRCIIVSTILFIGAAALSFVLQLSAWQIVLSYLLCMFILAKYGSIGTAKNPIRSAKKRQLLKRKTFLKVLFFMCCSLLLANHQLQIQILLGVVLTTLLASPLGYKFFEWSE